MKTTLLFLSVALMLVWTCAGAQIRDKRLESAVVSDNHCVPGSTWFDGCNNCFCSEDGIVICTERACIKLPLISEEDDPLPHAIKKITKRSSDDKLEECQPGTTWTRDCNKCVCTQNGRIACSWKHCV